MNLPKGEIPGARNGKYKPVPAFMPQIQVKSLIDIPVSCYTQCTWIYDVPTQTWGLKYANGFCPKHSSLAGGLEI